MIKIFKDAFCFSPQSLIDIKYPPRVNSSYTHISLKKAQNNLADFVNEFELDDLIKTNPLLCIVGLIKPSAETLCNFPSKSFALLLALN